MSVALNCRKKIVRIDESDRFAQYAEPTRLDGSEWIFVRPDVPRKPHVGWAGVVVLLGLLAFWALFWWEVTQ